MVLLEIWVVAVPLGWRSKPIASVPLPAMWVMLLLLMVPLLVPPSVEACVTLIATLPVPSEVLLRMS